MKVNPIKSLDDLPRETLFAVMRPLLSNVPAMEDATITRRPRCGRMCWKTPREPATLPANVVPRCTECALRIHLEHLQKEIKP